MSFNYREILKQYWGYDSFRSLQEEIINSISTGKDTLGLMPTGGGKSITFQVPALATDGICLVVTPLIALMKDQVENLKQKGIKALAIHSGLTYREIQTALDNCIYGDYKFLYLSPERLSTELFISNIQYLPVNILTVDEAHCISQWGYDFRPSYLKIAEIRQYIPDVPILALTATATPNVVDDIQEKLLFKGKNVFKKSFERQNLAYVVRHTENKYEQTIKILKSVKGSSIIYVRSRKKTREYAQYLMQNGISADYFHAGLTPKIKDQKQMQWKKNQTRVIVATNAFGMGIDKPDVRAVIHIDAPDALEAYFQEAGRAGRDGLKSYAVLLWSPNDKAQLNRSISTSFPELAIVRKVYDSLSSFFTIAEGDGMNETYDFNIGRFCAAFGFNIQTVLNSLKILQSAGYITFSEEVNLQTQVKILLDNLELYKFQVSNLKYDLFIKTLLRSYTGLFTEYASIDEEVLAIRMKLTRDEVYNTFLSLSRFGVIHYIPQRQTPLITYHTRREESKRLIFPPEIYQIRKEIYKQRVEAVINYATKNQCRSRYLLSYFGQKEINNCGYCDYCIEQRKTELTDREFEAISLKIKEIISEKKMTSEQIIISLPFEQSKTLKALLWLEDTEIVIEDSEGNFYIK